MGVGGWEGGQIFLALFMFLVSHQSHLLIIVTAVVTAVGLSLYLEQTICLLSYSFFFYKTEHR